MKKVSILTISMVVVIAVVLFLTIPRQPEIVVGVFDDFSGPENSWSNLAYNGVLLAVEELNEAQNDVNYVTKKIDVSVYDTDAKLDDQLDELNVDIILGPSLTSVLINWADYLLNQDRLVFITSADHNNVSGQDDTVYRFMNSTSLQAKQTAELFASQGYENIYMMYDSDNPDYTKEFHDYFVGDASLTDVTITSHELVDYSNDFTSDIDSSYDVILICAESSKTAHTINNLRESGITQPVFITSFADSGIFIETLDLTSEDVYLYSNRNVQYPEAYNLFNISFYDRFDMLPAIPSSLSYEYMFYIHSILPIVDYQVEDIATYTNNLTQHHGLFMTYYNNNNGDFYTTMGLYTVQNQTFVKIGANDIE